MALPDPNYPANPWDGNEQTQPVLPPGGTDIANASDYNEAAAEGKAHGDDLRAANVAGGQANHAAVHTDQELRIDALEAAPAGGQVDTIQAGAGIAVDDTDPVSPIISATGGAGGGPDEFICKTADEQVTNSTVVQDDDELKFSVAAGEKWFAQFVIYSTGQNADPFPPPPAVGLKGTIDLGAGAPAFARFNLLLTTVAFGGELIFTSGTQLSVTVLTVSLDNTGGDVAELKFRWAQSVSDARPVTVKKGSQLLAWKQ